MKTPGIEAIKARHEAATSGHLDIQPNGIFGPPPRRKHVFVPDVDGYFDVGDTELKGDLDFIAHSHEDLSTLLQAYGEQGKKIKRLEGVNKKYKEVVGLMQAYETAKSVVGVSPEQEKFLADGWREKMIVDIELALKSAQALTPECEPIPGK